MNRIDCLLIGHNQITGVKCEKTSRVMWDRNSQFYKEAVTLRYIQYKGNRYTPTQASYLFEKDQADGESCKYLSYENTLNGAVAYLYSYLNKNGFTADYINCFKSEKEKLAELIDSGKVDVVAISTSIYTTVFPILEITSFIKKLDKNIKIVVGGPYISNQVRSLELDELLKLFAAVGADAFVYDNEGEQTLIRVLNAFKNGMPLSSINNIFFKNGEEYTFTYPDIEVNDPGKNMIDWSLFKGCRQKYFNVRTAISCPFSCAFCGYPKYAGQYRQLSISDIEKELDMLKENVGDVGIYFIDDTFNFPPKRFKEILKIMIKNKYNFKWHSFFRCQYADREMVELMLQSGCKMVYCGIESGSQTILDNMNKKAAVSEYRKGISLLNEYHIPNIASVIIGFPGETYETYMDTYNFIEENKPTFFRSHIWYADPNSPIYEKKAKYNLEGSGYEWSHSTLDAAAAVELTDEMFLKIENSIYDSDYPVSYDLLMRGYNIEQVKAFINAFDLCMKDSLKSPETLEANPAYIAMMRYALSK